MADDSGVAEVRDVLDKMAGAYASKDVDAVLECFVDDGLVLVGTGADEVRFGMAEAQAQVERDMSQADELSFDVENFRAHVVDDAAFAYADVTFRGEAGGQSFEVPARWTAGVVRTPDGWRFAQFHVSVAFGDQSEGESFPTGP